MNGQDIAKIIIAVLSILVATSFIFKFRKTNKDSNNKNNINQNGISFTGDINQSGRDNNVRKK